MTEVAKAGLSVPGGATFSFRLRELEEERERIEVLLGVAQAPKEHAGPPPLWAVILGIVSLATLVGIVVSVLAA